MTTRLRAAAAVLCAAALAAACSSAPAPRPAPGELRLDWVEAAVPVPPGMTGRVALRDAAACDGHWYVVGGVVDAAGNSQPAAWSSTDGRTWTALRLTPHTFYGKQNTLYSVGCRGGRPAAVGAKTGGVHGNPRVASWHALPDGTLDEVIAAFEQYGGPNAISVARLATGPAGWLIAGTRTSGAAVWVSPDAAEFTIVEAAPGLANDARWQTVATDAVPFAGRWVVVGAGTHPGQVGRDPLAWTSTDGRRWEREDVPGDETYEELHRVVALGDGVLAAGVRGQTFGAWRGGGSGWRTAGRFGSTAGDRVPTLTGLGVAGDTAFAVTSSGDAYALFASTDGGQGWRSVPVPAVAQPGSDHAAAVTGMGRNILLLVDDGRTTRLWLAALSSGR